MNNPSISNLHWQIANNTDSVDIRAKSIGLNATRFSFPRDVADHIHADRGLHIQIRHNKDRQTFDQANQLAKLLTAAPEMLNVCLLILEEWEKPTDGVLKGELIGRLSQYSELARKAVKKARGEL